MSSKLTEVSEKLDYLNTKHYQMKELLEWSSRKDQPEIIKQMTNSMSENMKKLEGHLKYI